MAKAAAARPATPISTTLWTAPAVGWLVVEADDEVAAEDEVPVEEALADVWAAVTVFLSDHLDIHVGAVRTHQTCLRKLGSRMWQWWRW
jgi:hypothetical protein